MPSSRRLSAWLLAGTAALAVAALQAPATHAAPAPAAVRWSADLSRPADQTAIRHRGGAVTGTAPRATLLLPARALDRPVQRVDARLTDRVPAGAAVGVEARGEVAGGGWTEWREVAAGTVTLPSPSRSVQLRLTLTGTTAPTVSALRLSAVPASAAPATVRPAVTPVTAHVFATREGLVGSTTANGHVITSRDHFVALPSPRGLSPKGSDDYSVKLCNPANGRCETAPVWDVGPWNTKDDYWNPSSVRQSFTDLAQGMPEAQAAYQNGYHGGKDGFGRTVTNPAGIDLADGTFWDGLGLTDNGWVDVTYLWTAGGTPVSTWPTVSQGASGERVKTIQYLLNDRGAGLQVDGQFGPATLAAVKSFQSAQKLQVDGIVGPNTWGALVETVQLGSTGAAVRAVQSQLTSHGITTTVNGTFDTTTQANVERFQTAAGLTASGTVDTATWKSLVA